MKRLKKTVAGTLAMLMALSVFAFAGCKEKDVAQGNIPQVGETQQAQQGNKETGEVSAEKQPYDGQVVRAGGTYEFTNKIAFLSSELNAVSEGEITEPLAISLTATVTPADAKQDVLWSVAFVNADSEWATGKTVTDYVTVEPTTEDGTTVAVTCKAAFSEQIKIICASKYNPEITAECLVDFVSEATKVSLNLGEFAVNLGGQTDVTWELGAADGWGGTANVMIESEKEGTLTDNYTWQIDLVSPEWYGSGISSLEKYEGEAVASHYSDYKTEGIPFWQYETYERIGSWTGGGYYNNGAWGYFVGYGTEYFKSTDAENSITDEKSLSDGCLIVNGIDCFMRRKYNVTSFRFDYTTYQESYLGGLSSEDGYGYFSNGYSKTLIKDYYHDSSISTLKYATEIGEYTNLPTATITDGRLYTLVLTLTNTTTGEVTPYLSLLNLTKFEISASVTAIALSKNQISVSENEIW